jgi:hypothetical protein
LTGRGAGVAKVIVFFVAIGFTALLAIAPAPIALRVRNFRVVATPLVKFVKVIGLLVVGNQVRPASVEYSTLTIVEPLVLPSV